MVEDDTIMAHRINERNAGDWSLECEPKRQASKPKKVSRSFTQEEVELFRYLIDQIAGNVKLDASDKDNQVYRDNGDILIQFSRDHITAFRALITKFE